MSETSRFLAGVVTVLFLMASVGSGVAEETQDSPLYAYTLQTALKRMEEQTTLVTLPESPLAPAAEGQEHGGVFMPEPVLAQAATSQPVGPTVCHPERTLCPQRPTACPPVVPTACPEKTTLCPQYATMCPPANTTCPPLSTRCPTGPTNCPLVRTECPARNTACPPQVPTTCPERTTQCPNYATMCPMNDTTCPQRHTYCPPVTTECPPQRTVCPPRLTACPRYIPTTCPAETTECPVRTTVCPGGGTNCPAVDTACPFRGTACPPTCGPGGPTVTFLLPTGNPLTDATAEQWFDTNIPGVLVVLCRVVAANLPPQPAGYYDDKMRLSIDAVGNSQLQWQRASGVPSPWLGAGQGQPPGTAPLMGQGIWDAANAWWEVSAVFTGMPVSNGAFGPKRIYAQVVDGGAVIAESVPRQDIEVFYDRWGKPRGNETTPPWNNPGTGNLVGPNWFYYWKVGAGTPSAVVSGNSPEMTAIIQLGVFTPDWLYEPNTGPNTIAFYVPGETFVHIGPVSNTYYGYNGALLAPETFTHKTAPGVTITVTGDGLGPYFLAEVISHECMHMWYYEVIGPQIAVAELNGGEDNGDPNDDPDDDGVPNVQESGFLSISSDPNDPDTYDLFSIFGTYDTYGDQEIRCRMRSLINHGGMAITEANEWARPGWNMAPLPPWPTPPEGRAW